MADFNAVVSEHLDSRPHRLRAAQGVLLAVGAPLGWMLIVWLSGGELQSELQLRPGVYLYMLFGTMFAFGGFGWFVGHHEERAMVLSLRDTLTGLPNRLLFNESAQLAFLRMQRQPDRRLALLMADIDHFKAVNDTYGHGFGDVVLQSLARTLQQVLRAGEAVFRIGGEEFVVLVQGGGEDAGMNLAERLREAVEHSAITETRTGARVAVTVSIGVAACNGRDGLDLDQLLRRSDQAMYAAKQAGRNRVCAYQEAAVQTPQSATH